MMTDMFGHALQVGDKVVFTRKTGSISGYGLIKGTIATVSKTGHACTIDHEEHDIPAPLHIRLSECILKYDWTNEDV